ncbi:MAG: hypothetical protein U0798_08560 [Gemmataceae bacterium]
MSAKIGYRSEPIRDLLMRGERILLIVSVVFALVAARPYAGSWNDGSRLATVETLVERNTLCIDHSIFVSVPEEREGRPLPYPRDREDLLTHGTQDKLYIGGHFYSDKTPLPSVYLAGVYQVYRWLGGPTALDRPDWFCRVMTWFSAGVSFVLAIAGVLAIGRRLGLSDRLRLEIAAAFGFATILPGYAGTVNAHIIQLALAVWLFHGLLTIPTVSRPMRWIAWCGILTGMAYSADASAGLTLLVAVVIGLLGMTRSPIAVLTLLLFASPFILGHHVINYWVGGSLAPANANPDYFHWEGSPFTTGKITGRWRHGTSLHFLEYCGDLLFGKQGFLFHNLPLLLLGVWSWPLLKCAKRERAIVFTAVLWCLATFFLAAVSSTNRSGQCLSVRWFLPLLAPGFMALAMLLQDRPSLIPEFRLLALWGVPLAVGSAIYGLWIPHMIPGYWGIIAGALVSWVVFAVYRTNKEWFRFDLSFPFFVGKRMKDAVV